MGKSFQDMAEVMEDLKAGKKGGVTRDSVPIDLLQDRIQLRHKDTPRPVATYAEQMKGGQIFPAVPVFVDPTTGDLVVPDGNSRLEAAAMAGLTTFTVEFRFGTRRDAIMLAAKVNNCHGLAASLDDRRNAAMALLRDAEWGSWSNRHIGRIVGLSAPTVDVLREGLTAENLANGLSPMSPDSRKYLRGGKVHKTKITPKAAKKDPCSHIVGWVLRATKDFEADAKHQLAEKLIFALTSNTPLNP